MLLCASLQTVATNVDVFALAGAQDTAVAVQIPAFNLEGNLNFDIAFPHVVRYPWGLYSATCRDIWQALGLHVLLPCMSDSSLLSQQLAACFMLDAT